MQEILQHMHDFELIYFGEQTLFEQEIQDWPIVDVLIVFYSTGFPQQKAEEYVNLRKPFLVNDLKAQRFLRDRRKVYKICQENGIPIPNFIAVNRKNSEDNFADEYEANANDLIETADFIELNGQRIFKPFVEKPVDADDHNVFIYLKEGGRRELFRKVGDKSSDYFPDRSKVRRDGSFIYEEFLQTDGMDIKVYAVTGSYAYAEGRKSPVVDGIVLRNENRTEVRYPIELSSSEKDFAQKICMVFKQQVCGFDLLRCSNGTTIVCDINGWSFVKDSPMHLKETAIILSRYLHEALNLRNLNKIDEIVNFVYVKPKIMSFKPEQQETVIAEESLDCQGSAEGTSRATSMNLTELNSSGNCYLM